METIDKKKSFEMVCRVMDNIPQCTYKDPSEVIDQYEYFKDIKIPATTTRKVGLCIGRDYPDLLTYGKIMKAGKNKPIAYETVLGWSVSYPRKYDEDEDYDEDNLLMANIIWFVVVFISSMLVCCACIWLTVCCCCFRNNH